MGDGFSDVFVGARGSGGGGAVSGTAYLLLGPRTGFVDLPLAYALLIGEPSTDQAGHAVAACGDVNGDGSPNLLVGAPGHDEGYTDVGAAYVVLGTGL